MLVDGPICGHLEQTIQKIFLPLLILGTGLPSVKINIASTSILISNKLVINSGSMRQGDHFSQTKKKSVEPLIDIIDTCYD